MSQAFTKEQMAEAIAELREKIAEAAQASGRQKQDIMLCAVCKTRSSDTVRLSAELDVDLFGENHMQELVMHAQDGAYLNKSAHFIGHLQTNKVKKVVGLAEVIQSVDSLKLVEAIDAEAKKQNLVQDIMFEINIGLEQSKSGFSAQELMPMLDKAAAMENIRIRGLMAIPPAIATPKENRMYFAMMRELYEKLKSQNIPNMKADILSMGMSGSFYDAILEGANLVRVGTAIYGQRDYLNKI